MLLFRSEEHVARWLGPDPGGESLPVTTLCELAHAWYGDRLSPDWTARTREQNQAMLDRLDLAGDFWRLP